MAPAAVPTPIVARLQQAADEVLRDPDLVSRLRSAGFDTEPISAAAFGAEIKSDMERWSGVIKDANITRE